MGLGRPNVGLLACKPDALCLPPGAKGAKRAKPLQAGTGVGLGGSEPVPMAP